MAALPWALAAVSVVSPALLTQSLYRYVIVAIPLACLAAGLAFADLRPRQARHTRQTTASQITVGQTTAGHTTASQATADQTTPSQTTPGQTTASRPSLDPTSQTTSAPQATASGFTPAPQPGRNPGPS
jgi:hypothetical protein